MAVQITTTELPNGFVGTAYSQTIQTIGGQAPLVFAVDSGTLPAGTSLNTSTGVISGTPTTAANYNFVIEVTDDDTTVDTQSYSVRIYAPLNPSPDELVEGEGVVIEAGSQQQFSVTGGSGNYVWSVDGGNLINPNTGLLTAINGGQFTVTVTDAESGQSASIEIVITSQSQFCVQGTQVASAAQVRVLDNSCCEFNVECGERLQLRIPSFHIIENGERKPVVYSNLVQAVTGDASALQSRAAVAGASGNEVSFNRDAYFEIVTSYDMAQVGNGEFGIGWSAEDSDPTVGSIDHAVVWFTESGSRYVEIRHSSSVEGSSTFPIGQGDAVSFGVIDGQLQLWINSVHKFTSEEDFASCGNNVLDIGIEGTGKTIGGYVTNLTWVIQTSGTAAQVGSVDANGVYTSPQDPIAGVVKVSATLNTANFFVNVRNIQPTPMFTNPNSRLQGRKAHIWVTNKKATDNDVIRIASDGSPDAIQNPGMIYLGVLAESATFSEDIQRQDFTDDDGIYFTSVASEQATLTGRFLDVRDLDKLALLMQHATKFPNGRGYKELGVGGKACGGCDLRVAMIVESGVCGGGWDVIYIPRAQDNGNLVLEIGKKTASGLDLNFRVLPDTSRPAGKQLYSIYQIENCSNKEDNVVCD